MAITLAIHLHARDSGMTAYAGGSPSDGDPIKQWNDISGNDDHLYSSDYDSTVCPTYQTDEFGYNNDLPSVKADGVNDWMSNASIDFGTNAIFVVVVFQANDLQAASDLETIAATKNAGTTAPGWAITAGNGYTHTQYNFIDGEVYDGSTFKSEDARYFNGNNSVWASWHLLQDTGVCVMWQFASHADGGNGLRLFQFADGGNLGSINLAEIRIYTGTASSAERDTIWSEVKEDWNFGDNILVQIAQSSDDAEEVIDYGNTDTTSGDLSYGYWQWASDARQVVGLRFQNIALEKNEQLRQARVYNYCLNNTTGTSPSLTITGEDTDDASAFSAGSGNYDISGRTDTSASVSWTSIMAWYQNRNYVSPDLVSIIEEIRSGY